MKKKARMPLRVVFYRDEGDKSFWVAHCLEFDLLGHGKTKLDAMQLLTEAVALQIENSLKAGNIKSLFTSAPAEYQMMYAEGRDIAGGELRIELHYDDFETTETDVREYDDGYSGAGSGRAVATV